VKDSDLKTISSNLMRLSERADRETYLVCKHNKTLYFRGGWNLFVVKDGLCLEAPYGRQVAQLDLPYLHSWAADNLWDGEIKLEFVKRFKSKKEVSKFLDKKEREKKQ
jgi:hypothetical protein